MAHIIYDDDSDSDTRTLPANSRNDGVVRGVIQGNTLDLNFTSVAFLPSVIDSLRFTPKSRRPCRLLMRSSTQIIGNRTDEGASEGILIQLFTGLEAFPFESVEIDGFAFDVPVRSLAGLLRRTGPELENLNLSGFSLSGYEDEAAFDTLCRAIEAAQPLDTACLRNPFPSSVSDSLTRRGSAVRLLRSLASQSRSLSVDVTNLCSTFDRARGRGLDQRALRAEQQDTTHQREQPFFEVLAGALVSPDAAMTSLTVSLSDTRSLLPIVVALQQNRTLKTMALCARPNHTIGVVPVEVIQAFRDMTRDNFVLQEVTVKYWHDRATQNFAELPGVDDCDIALYLKLNEAGRQFLLQSEQSTRQDWVDTIIEHREDTRVVQYFLSKNPSICGAV